MDRIDPEAQVSPIPVLFEGLFQSTANLPEDVRETFTRQLNQLQEQTELLRESYLHASVERWDAEHRLRESEQRFRQVLDTSYEGIWTVDTLGITDFVNNRAAEILGYTVDEIIGQPAFRFLFSDEDVLRAGQTLESLISGFRGSVQAHARHKDGSEVILLVSTSPIHDENGAFRGGFAMFSDITERVQIEQALLQANSQFQALIENLPVGVVMTNAQGEIIISNPANERLFGRQGVTGSAAGPTGGYTLHHPDGTLFSAEDLPLVRALAGESSQGVELLIRPEDGEERLVIANTCPITAPDGSITGAVAVMQDITQMVQAEKALRESEIRQIEDRTQMEVQRRLMENREHERQEIAREIHDGPIQTLISIIFNLQYTKDVNQEQPLRQELDRTTQSLREVVQDLRNMINDLRPPSLIRFGLARAIQMHAEDFQERNPEIAIELDLTTETNNLPEETRLNLFRIYQEAMNNIVRHSDANRVAVTYYAQGERYYLRVEDNGKGFDAPGDLTQLTSENHFGLAGMKERAETIGAVFSVNADAGKGTQVTVRGPARLVKNEQMFDN